MKRKNESNHSVRYDPESNQADADSDESSVTNTGVIFTLGENGVDGLPSYEEATAKP